jgi:hypothetical protein
MSPIALTTVLCRTDLRRGQITLLKLFYERDEPIGREELAKTLRGDIHEDHEQSLSGVLGAFGKRINATDEIDGNPGTGLFLKKERINDELHYQLRPEAREAIESVPALLQKFDEPWIELLESGTNIEAVELIPDSE